MLKSSAIPGPSPASNATISCPNSQPAPVPARNRRIGEFLKELGLAEGRLSGVPKIFDAMRANGSPPPRFEFDETRTFFRATLPAHPEYAALSALRDAAHLRAVGAEAEAFRRVEAAWEADPTSATLAAEMIRMYAADGDTERAEAVYDRFAEQGPHDAAPQVRHALTDALREGDRV